MASRARSAINERHPPTGREIRVFVSSTFRDMQAERDELMESVFYHAFAAASLRKTTKPAWARILGKARTAARS
ncbi:MAG: DUF4062 domain-containing protein [Rhodopirellula sp.]|nr:DUF4062 domain-containing protein [Rhodopirellula sp.]